MTSIPASLKKLRKKYNITQKELSYVLGLTPSAVSNWENGINKIDIEKLVLICSKFKISLSEFLGIDDNGFTLSEDEIELINSYRQQPHMQEAVKRLLNM